MFHWHTILIGFVRVRAARVLRVMTRAQSTATVSIVAHRLTTRAKSISFPNATAVKMLKKLSYAARVRTTMIAFPHRVLAVECAIVSDKSRLQKY